MHLVTRAHLVARIESGAMHQLNPVISEAKAAMHFHRGRARNYFIGILLLAMVVFVAAFAFGGYTIQLMQTVGAVIATANIKGLAPDSHPDYVSLASKNGLGYAMISGFVLALFVVAGLLRHHVKRATIAEDRLYHLLKVDCLRSPETGLSAIAQKSLLDLRENYQASAADSEAHAGLAVIERILQSLGQSISDIGNRAGKRNAS